MGRYPSETAIEGHDLSELFYVFGGRFGEQDVLSDVAQTPSGALV